MEYMEIVNIISSVGFPIVMCLIAFRYIKQKDEQYINERAIAREEQKTLNKELSEAVNNNTKAISTLCDRLRDV